MTDSAGPILEARGLRKSFWRGGRAFLALDGVDFSLDAGETLALVGPSGSGKSTIARIVARLIEADGGEMRFRDVDLRGLGGRALRQERRHLQMVFQDPLASFNPRATVEKVIDDPLRIHGIVSHDARPRAVGALLERVGLPDALRNRRVHEISGGQRQRVAIARAIATRPRLIILDEALSALDVSVRARIVDLLLDLQQSLDIAYLFISHDLALVHAIAHRIAILDGGRIVESGTAAGIIAAPGSAMGQALVRAVPQLPRFEAK